MQIDYKYNILKYPMSQLEYTLYVLSYVALQTSDFSTASVIITNNRLNQHSTFSLKFCTDYRYFLDQA